jgi:DNA-binding NtrC family response regulator/tetratricopeptide (TPR) repeat protein
MTDKLRILRDRVSLAATPAERVKARLQLGEELWVSDPASAKPLLEQVVAEADDVGQIKDGGRAASILSEMLRRAGDLDGSARYAAYVLKVADSTGEKQVRASGLNLVGLIHQERGEYQRALECFDEFLELSRETGFEKGEQSAMNQLAGVYALRGETGKALACYEQCLELSTRREDTHGRAIHLCNIGWMLESMGRWTEAAGRFHRSIALCEEHNFRDQLMAARIALGELSLRRSDYENAALMFDSVIKAERETKQAGYLLRDALSHLGWTHFRSGNLAKAEETLNEAARLSEAAGDRCGLATINRRRADLALAQGRLKAAEDFLAQAASHARDLRLRKEEGEVLCVQASLAAARGESGPGLELFGRSEAMLEPLGDTYELALSRLRHGRVLLDLHRIDEALPLLWAAAKTFRRLSVVAEGEETNHLLYRLEVQTDSDKALLEGLAGLAALGLGPERFLERALLMLCDHLKFEQGAVLFNGGPVALKGQPDLAAIPSKDSPLSQTKLTLFLPVRRDDRLLGTVWLLRWLPRATRVRLRVLEGVCSVLAPTLAGLAGLKSIEGGRGTQIPGLNFQGVVGENPTVLNALTLVSRVAPTTLPVLIRGESGSGKELVARALHKSGSRAEHPFVTVNCAAVPESLLEAEFFGVEAGAATGVAARPGKFELAHTGTIFLDEIGDMSPTLQAKIVRVIEEKTFTRVGGTKEMQVDVRVVAATNADLETRRFQGLFRSDLLYRLNTVQVSLPPLRQRREDMLALTQHFVARTAQQYGRSVRRVSDEVMALFAAFSWPGNIRQLQHVVERAVIIADGDTIRVSDLPPEVQETKTAPAAQEPAGIRGARRRGGDEAEREAVLQTFQQANGSVREAAKLAGYSRAQFYRLLRKHRISETH